jgi:hypothetical protein
MPGDVQGACSHTLADVRPVSRVLARGDRPRRTIQRGEKTECKAAKLVLGAERELVGP